mmetsp:Transcript_15175/g.26557  ORF Transcript_15175/g.26557 Transcript_15175/m.26557 type:complete len:93 (+) Transcript_15175:2653-2931(+)
MWPWAGAGESSAAQPAPGAHLAQREFRERRERAGLLWALGSSLVHLKMETATSLMATALVDEVERILWKLPAGEMETQLDETVRGALVGQMK